jgi:uncharacterized phage protein (TIGR02218 family)
VDLSLREYRAEGAVLALAAAQQFSADGLQGFAEAWFTGGRLVWTSGANAGLAGHVKSHLLAGPEAMVELWLSPPMPIMPGDVFEVTAGCDKAAATCAAKFGNLLNFRGFPHMPGDDVVASYPSTGGVHDGGSLFRS